MDARTISRARQPLDAEISAPPSKSVTHRALVAAALASGPSTLHRPLDADDTRVTLRGLERLGVRVREDAGCWLVHGCGGSLPGGGRLDLGESGSSARLLIAVAALGVEPATLDGAPRLRQRPMREIARALNEIGGEVRFASADADLPLSAGGRPPQGGVVSVASSQSSQFASALMLIGPRLTMGLDMTLEPPVVSLPYVKLTASVLGEFGVDVIPHGERRWVVPCQDYPGRDYTVEGDHSSSSYFLAAPCLVGGRVRVRALSTRSRQADARLGSILTGLGCEVRDFGDGIEVRGTGEVPAFDLDMADAPDLVPTVAVLGLFASGPCTIRGIAHLRWKESDRLEMLAANLRALGRPATAEADGLSIGPPTGELRGTRLPTADDHRMAMAFALAGLRQSGISVENPACVAKSNPRFWEQFAELES
jgi:3-phosphoshikimate 1-carboxyvinyltransferase